MKLNKLLSVSALALVTASGAAYAQQVTPVDRDSIDAPVIGEKTAPDFASYSFVDDVSVVSASSVGSNDVLGTVGSMRVVRGAPSTNNATRDLEKRNEGSVVRNVITGEYGVLTGNIMIAAPSSVISQIEADFGVTRLKSYEEISVFLVKAPSDSDVKELANQISQIAAVKEARIDVIDNSQKPM